MSTAMLTPRKLNIAELNRKAAYKLKNGSPKFKDVLRARCRARLKENRERIINNLRNIHPCADVDDFLSTLENFESTDTFSCDVGLETEENTLTKEGNEFVWLSSMSGEGNRKPTEEEIVAEYESLLANEEEMFSEMLQKSLEGEVVCPMCQKTAMAMEAMFPSGSCIVCHKCRISIPVWSSLQDIRLHTQSCVNNHSSMCPHKPQFHLVPEDVTHVYIMCSQCSYLNIFL